MSTSLVIITPHPDDAALCLGGWLSTLPVRYKKHVIGVVVFTESVYSPRIPRLCNRTAVSKLRRKEEESFWNSVGITWIDLKLPDSSLLWEDADQYECSNLTTVEDPRFRDVASALESNLPTQAFCLAPCGIGNHIDHRLARDALMELRPGSSIAFYEDLPYSTQSGVHVDCKTKDLMNVEWLTRWPIQRIKKKLMLELYQSQLDDMQIQQVLFHAHALGRTTFRERVWTIEHSHSLRGILLDFGFVEA